MFLFFFSARLSVLKNIDCRRSSQHSALDVFPTVAFKTYTQHPPVELVPFVLVLTVLGTESSSHGPVIERKVPPLSSGSLRRRAIRGCSASSSSNSRKHPGLRLQQQ